MKLFSNLPRLLRILFGAFRLLTVVVVVFGICGFLFLSWAKKQSADDPKLIWNMGEVTLRLDHPPAAVSAGIDHTKSVQLDNLRRYLQLDILTDDTEMKSALRWTILPMAILIVIYQWIILGALRSVCGQIEKGAIFSKRNLRTVRNIGLLMITFSLIGGVVELWSTHVMSNYLNTHVVIADMFPNLGFDAETGASLRYKVSEGLIYSIDSLLMGVVVLVIGEVFRQGLALKKENDLTV